MRAIVRLDHEVKYEDEKDILTETDGTEVIMEENHDMVQEDAIRVDRSID